MFIITKVYRRRAYWVLCYVGIRRAVDRNMYLVTAINIWSIICSLYMISGDHTYLHQHLQAVYSLLPAITNFFTEPMDSGG